TPDPVGPPPDDWKAFEGPNRVRAKMPGVPVQNIQSVPGGLGLQIVMHSVSDQDSIYAVGWSEGQMPAERRALPAEKILNDSCDGALATTRGASESSRKSVQIGPHPGKMMVLRVPEGRGKVIMCYYFNEKVGRLYMALVGGKGFGESSKQVRWFLESF